MDDLISRQEAIDALDALCDRECEYSKKQRSVMCGACHLGSAFDIIEQLPTAEPSTTIMKVEVGVDKESLRKAMEEAELTLLPAEPNHDGFLEFLFNVINPNEMEQYMAMYNSHPNCGARMEESDDGLV